MARLKPVRATVSSVAAAAVLAASAIAGVGTAAAGEAPSLEYAIKATYLYKFAPFVEWPPAAFAGASAPFGICVAGQDPFGSTLDASVRGQAVGSHPIVVRRLRPGEAVSGCHILYLGPSSPQRGAEMLRAAAGQPILTVTDQAARGPGGIIQFVVKDGRVRFSIDAAAAGASGVQISSKLMGLAVSVRRPNP